MVGLFLFYLSKKNIFFKSVLSNAVDLTIIKSYKSTISRRPILIYPLKFTRTDLATGNPSSKITLFAKFMLDKLLIC